VRDAMRNTGFVLPGSAGELRMGRPSSLTGLVAMWMVVLAFERVSHYFVD
jgi:hypothetical protein